MRFLDMSGRAMLLAALIAGRTLAAQEDAAVTITDDTDNKRFVIAIGPMHLEPMNVDDGDHSHGGHDGIFPPVTTLAFPRHAYLVGFSWDVVDGAGNPMPRAVLHHLNVIDPVHRELFLPVSQRMAAVGSETSGQSLPALFMGYPVTAGQQFVVATMMHNPTGQELHDVYVRFFFDYVDVGRPWPLAEVYPFQLDVAFPAGDKSFPLPPGRSSHSYEASPAMAGRLMGIGGHLHENAVNITFENVTTGDVIYDGRPILSDSGTLAGVTVGRLYWRGGVSLDPAHTYRVTVTYDNPGPDTLEAGGMGVVGGVFMPRAGYPWPRADVTDSLYLIDRAHYLRQWRGSLDSFLASGGVLSAPAPASDGHTDHEH